MVYHRSTIEAGVATCPEGQMGTGDDIVLESVLLGVALNLGARQPQSGANIPRTPVPGATSSRALSATWRF